MGKYYVPKDVKNRRKAIKGICESRQIRLLNNEGSLWWALNTKNGVKLNPSKFDTEDELLDWLWNYFGNHL